jgi:hypothetical protein
VAKESIASNPEKVKPAFEPSAERRAEYERTYYRLMYMARGRLKIKGEHETHHIVPRAIGGSDSKDNLVHLTYREHFLAHWLLALFTEGEARYKMLRALYYMLQKSKNHSDRKVTSWQYERAQRANREASLGNQNAKGYQPTAERRTAQSIFMTGNQYALGYHHTEDARRRMSQRRQGPDHPMARVVKCLNDGRIFNTVKEAAEFYGVHGSNISKVCRKNKNYLHTGGYQFEYI